MLRPPTRSFYLAFRSTSSAMRNLHDAGNASSAGSNSSHGRNPSHNHQPGSAASHRHSEPKHNYHRNPNHSANPDAPPPLILTLRLSPDLAHTLTALRTRYFPPQQNHLPAHLTLFHAIPADKYQDLVREVEDVAHSLQPFGVVLQHPFLLGGRANPKGVGLELAAPPQLRNLHAHIQHAPKLNPYLTQQDRQPIRPHITIQNKVGPEEARRCFEEVRGGWRDIGGEGQGLDLWEYMGGPWVWKGFVGFGGGKGVESDAGPPE
ncbi:hypothetical protein SAICODRAFT_21032 [Saitoella complicata NRRL Y-17804]|nr:uncharacterized protein SAICODRAFT_21032 [Saitoella complicata NRRL Y-17804]ODQ50993.1 hypothetical protein SAICODRAFT_21032 [Saitoella complicata NRRL Y-17804]